MSYPLWNTFLTMMWFFLWVLWLYLLFLIIADVFRSRDLNGWAKAAWIILICLLPYLGVFIYLIARGGKMQERRAQEAHARDQEFRSYVQDAAGNGSAEQLSALAQLRDEGVISQAEFERGKAKVLN
jgi:type VI protein secretion system component VasK